MEGGVIILPGSERVKKMEELIQQNQEQQKRIEDLEEMVAILFVNGGN